MQVPLQAVIEHGSKHYCLTYDSGEFEAHEIEAGEDNGKRVIITGGLEEGQEIVLGAETYLEEVELPELPTGGRKDVLRYSPGCTTSTGGRQAIRRLPGRLSAVAWQTPRRRGNRLQPVAAVTGAWRMGSPEERPSGAPLHHSLLQPDQLADFRFVGESIFGDQFDARVGETPRFFRHAGERQPSEPPGSPFCWGLGPPGRQFLPV